MTYPPLRLERMPWQEILGFCCCLYALLFVEEIFTGCRRVAWQLFPRIEWVLFAVFLLLSLFPSLIGWVCSSLFFFRIALGLSLLFSLYMSFAINLLSWENPVRILVKTVLRLQMGLATVATSRTLSPQRAGVSRLGLECAPTFRHWIAKHFLQAHSVLK